MQADFMILDRKFRAIDVIDIYESFIWTDRYSAYGDFEIYTSSSKEAIDKYKRDYYICSTHTDHVMIIDESKIESDIEFGNHLTIRGMSLESLLLRRIVWKQTTLDGYLQGQIQKLLNENVISPSDTKRKIPNFIFETSTDPTITSLKVSAQFTGDTLYDAIKKVCDISSIGFKITLNSNNQFVFKLYAGTDRSYDQTKNPYIVFSPNFENIINSNYYSTNRNLKNVALVAGEDQGTARRTVTIDDVGATGLDRRELFVDARDISSQNEDGSSMTTSQYDYLLRGRGYENLAGYKENSAFDGQVEATQLYRYGEDFFMGDITQLENEYGMESKVRVVEFIHSESTSDGVQDYPTFEVLEESE